MTTETIISDVRQTHETLFSNLKRGDNFVFPDNRGLFKKIYFSETNRDENNVIDLKTGDILSIEPSAWVIPVDIHIEIMANRAVSF